MSRYSKFFLPSLLFMVIPTLVCGATYYVDSTAGACAGTYSIAARNCSGSDGTSYATIQGALNVVSGTNTILVRAGTYAETATTSAGGGTDADNHLVIQAYNSEIVNVARFRISDTHDYVTITGFSIYDPRGGDNNLAGVRVYGDYNLIDGNTFRAIASSTKPCAVKITGASNTISNNTVDPDLTTESHTGTHDGGDNQGTLADSSLSMDVDALIGYYVYNWSDNSSCVVTDNDATTITCSLSGGTDNDWDDGDVFQCGPMFWMVFQNGGESNVYEDNIIKNLSDPERVWDFMSSGNNSDSTIIRGNELYGTTSTWGTYGPHPDILQNTAGTVYHRYILIEDNYFHDNDIQGSNLELSSSYMHSWIVRNNVWANNTRQWGPKVYGTKYYNNTIYNQGIGYPAGFFTDDDTEIINNIFIGQSGSSIFYLLDGSGTPEVNNNYYSSIPGTWTARDSGEVGDCSSGDFYATGISGGGWDTLGCCDDAAVNGGDPRFVAAYTNCLENACDFSLRADSPLIGAGMSLSASFIDDRNGIVRSVPWDIGAYEYNGGSSGSGAITGNGSGVFSGGGTGTLTSSPP